jgi:hypothetical protein
MFGNRYLVLMPALLVGLAIGATSQAKPSVAISVWAVKQPDAPLQVTGFQRSAVSTRGVEVLLRNVTERPIRAFRIIAEIRAACPESGESEVWGRGSALDKKLVAPGTSVEAAEQVADATVIDFARRLKTSYLHVQVGVLEVQFADGTVWTNKSPAGNQLFDPALVHLDAKRCSQWPTPGSELDQLKADATIVRDPSAGVMELRTDGYFMTCQLRDGKAFCPSY